MPAFAEIGLSLPSRHQPLIVNGLGPLAVARHWSTSANWLIRMAQVPRIRRLRVCPLLARDDHPPEVDGTACSSQGGAPRGPSMVSLGICLVSTDPSDS
jgi:hypothetical protein